jgi:macrolide transport system ATP-binding/permease protein
MRELLRRLSYLWNRNRLERELQDEMAYHREQMGADARKLFGDDLRLREDARESWGWTWLDRLQQDLSYGWRQLRKAPGFTVTALLVLALGIGVPLTAFRVVVGDIPGANASDPDSLVQLTRRAPNATMTTMTYPELEFYRAHATSFRSLMAVSQRNRLAFSETETTAAEPRGDAVTATFASVRYFEEFGATPLMGRGFTMDDERKDAGAVALVNEQFWRRRLGGDPAVVGRVVRLNGVPVRIVGVLQQSPQLRDQIALPITQHPYVVAGSTLLTDWNSALTIYGRLRPGVTPEASQEESRALASRLRDQWPDRVWKDEYLEARPILSFGPNDRAFGLIITSVALVLLLLVAACANLGTLVLARGVAREREIRVRMALGAGRLRVVRQLFTEAVLLAALSAGCALVLSTIVLKVLRVQDYSNAGLSPDWRVLVVTFATALCAALVFGLPPAFRLASLTPGRGRARGVFLGAQVAASCLLLVVSSLLATNREQMGDADPGFQYRQLVSIAPGLREHGYDQAAAQSYLGRLREQLESISGVTAVSQAWLAPWGGLHMSASYGGRDYSGNAVDPRFLDTMGLRVLRGRNVRPGERDVALVNEATARALWPNEDALGKTLPWPPAGRTIIGIVQNASTSFVGERDAREFYLSSGTDEAPDSVILVRVAGNPRDLVRRFQSAAYALDERLQPAVEVVADLHDREVDKATSAIAVIGALGAVANLLSIIGLAGLAGYTVAQRTREIAVRIALGARAIHVVRGILTPMVRPIGTGFVLGALGGAAVGATLRNGIPTMAALDVLDPLPYVMALAFFGAVVAVSILAPSRRATRIDPVQALKSE